MEFNPVAIFENAPIIKILTGVSHPAYFSGKNEIPKGKKIHMAKKEKTPAINNMLVES
jgi:hypothetical protein